MAECGKKNFRTPCVFHFFPHSFISVLKNCPFHHCFQYWNVAFFDTELHNSYLCNKLRKGHFFRTSGKIAKRAQRVSQRTRVTEKLPFRNELHITFCVMMKNPLKTPQNSLKPLKTQENLKKTPRNERVRKKVKNARSAEIVIYATSCVKGIFTARVEKLRNERSEFRKEHECCKNPVTQRVAYDILCNDEKEITKTPKNSLKTTKNRVQHVKNRLINKECGKNFSRTLRIKKKLVGECGKNFSRTLLFLVL